MSASPPTPAALAGRLVMLGFGSIGVPQIRTGVEVLAGALESLAHRRAA